jgi:hypothetical protein
MILICLTWVKDEVERLWDRGHDGKEIIQFQKDRVEEIVAVSEMEANEEV